VILLGLALAAASCCLLLPCGGGAQVLLILGQPEVHQGVAAAHPVIQEVARFHVPATQDMLLEWKGSMPMATVSGSGLMAVIMPQETRRHFGRKFFCINGKMCMEKIGKKSPFLR
jgi:hypothetical protein